MRTIELELPSGEEACIAVMVDDQEYHVFLGNPAFRQALDITLRVAQNDHAGHMFANLRVNLEQEPRG
jgi:hypothetical protein